VRSIDPRSVAVGVACTRQAARIPDLAAALSRLDPAPGLVIAVDDGGGDRTLQALQEAGFEVCAHPERLGIGHARNTLWRRAEDLGFQAVAFLDADVTPPGDYLRPVCELLAADGAAGVGGRCVDEAPSSRSDRWRSRFWSQDLGLSARLDADRLISSCATYRIAALRDVGGFNPHFRATGDDVDIGRRLRASGHRLVYDPAIAVTRRRVDTAGGLLSRCYRDCRDGMRATVGAEGPGPGPRHLVAGMTLKAVRAPASALVVRRDPAEAALGVAACGVGLLGYAVGWARPRPR